MYTPMKGSRGEAVLAALTTIGLLSLVAVSLSTFSVESESQSAQAAGSMSSSWQLKTVPKGTIGTRHKETVPLNVACKKGFDYIVDNRNSKVEVNAFTSCYNRDNQLKCQHETPPGAKDRATPEQDFASWECDTWYCTDSTCKEVKKAACQMSATNEAAQAGACTSPQTALKYQLSAVKNENEALDKNDIRPMSTGEYDSIVNVFQNCTNDRGGQRCTREEDDVINASEKMAAQEKRKMELKSLESVLKNTPTNAGNDMPPNCIPGSPGCYNQRAPGVQTGGGEGRLQPRGSGSGMGDVLGGLRALGGNSSPGRTNNTFGSLLGDSFSCSINASPAQIRRTPGQPGQAVQLRWSASGGNNQNPPYRSVIYEVGSMGPQGYANVYPQQTTEYTMTVYGYQNGSATCKTRVTVDGNFGTGTDGQLCSQPPAQPPSTQCSSGSWKSLSATNNGCVTGWQCVSTVTTAPTAELKCEPQSVDVGMNVGVVWGCGNANYSTGSGFGTAGQLTGATTSLVATTTGTITYGVACGNVTATTSASCSVQVASPVVVLVAIPERASRGQSVNLGWVTTTGSMSACRVSSPQLPDFSAQHSSGTATNGFARSPGISETTHFVLTCNTVGGSIRTATTTVTII